jgi:arylsulfatase A-like enzyme
MIVVDDLRDTVGFLENFSEVDTPNLDRLAQSGTTFTNAHCAAPACKPSRTAFLTGLSPATTGVYENHQQWSESLLTHDTLTREFMLNGYYVAGSGKIYHGSPDLPTWHAYHNEPWDEDYGEFGEPLGKPLDIPLEETRDGKRVAWLLDRLAETGDNPVFLACGIVKPHLPFNAPREYFEMFPLDQIKLPEVKDDDLADVPDIGKKIAVEYIWKGGRTTQEHVLEHDLWKKNIQAYLACVAFVDDLVGQLLDAWDASAHAEDGIVLLFGDHGWHLGEKEHWSKFTLWREGTRTPLVIRAPGVTRPGSVSAAPVSLIDVFPTLLELTGLPPREDLDGYPLTPLLRNPDLRWDLGAVTFHGHGNTSVFLEDWHYIHYSDGSKELYNLTEDPREFTNLAPRMEEDPEIRDRVY